MTPEKEALLYKYLWIKFSRRRELDVIITQLIGRLDDNAKQLYLNELALENDSKITSIESNTAAEKARLLAEKAEIERV